MVDDQLIAELGFSLKGQGDLKKFQAGLNNLEKQAVAVGAAISKAAAIAGAAVAGGLGLLGKSVIDTAAQFEKFEATLTTIEGSAEKAKKSLDWITDFAKTTPYEVSELTQSFVKLKSYGIEPMDGTMTVLGDTASAMGKSLNDAVEAFADATTGEFERLKQFGITSSSTKDKVTFTWQQGGKEMSRTIKKSGADIQKFLKDVWGQKFKGAMALQSKTWGGMISNLLDWWGAFQRKIADSGFFEKVKGQLGSVLDVLQRWESDGTMDRIARMFSNAFSGIADALGVVFDRIKTHISFLNKHWDAAGPYVKAFGAALLTLIAYAHPLKTLFVAIVAVVEDITTHFEGGVSVTGKWIDRFRGLGRAVADAWNSFEEFWDGIIRWRLDLEQKFKELGRDIAARLLDGLKSMGDEIKAWFMGLIPDWAKGYFGGAGGSSNGGAGGGKGIRARAGRSSAGGQGRVPLNSAEAGELSDAIKREAARIGASPEDLATLVSFETGGTFNKNKSGPVTQHGRHRGYIQWGEPQARQFGVDPATDSPSEQMRKVGDYMIKNGYKPGMTGEQLYATVNAGSPHKTGASDARNGGTWGTAADKWRYQMGGHRANARKLLQMGVGEAGAALPPVSPVFDPYSAKQNGPRRDGAAVTNSRVNVGDINVNVKQATDAPRAVAGAIRDASLGAIKPSRMQGGPVTA